jgi:hypothetical protein
LLAGMVCKTLWNYAAAVTQPTTSSSSSSSSSSASLSFADAFTQSECEDLLSLLTEFLSTCVDASIHVCIYACMNEPCDVVLDSHLMRMVS